LFSCYACAAGRLLTVGRERMALPAFFCAIFTS
jgi:hypothetical protein